MRNIDEVRSLVATRLNVKIDAFSSMAVCVFPHFVVPHQPYTIGWILQALGIDAIPYSPWLRYDYLVCFEDQTRNSIDVREFVTKSASRWLYDARSNEWVEGVPQVGMYINGDCLDISKRRVGKVVREVFGYPLDVDPTKVTGNIVRKSDVNAAHDGAIIVGPIDADEYERHRDQFVYSVPINNADGEYIDDLRVLWCGHICAMLDRKRRPLRSRFGHGGEVFHEPISQHFAAAEIERLAAFCIAFGLDYGELDVLRDKESGRIYVVDVNKTPNRPLQKMDPEYATTALTNMAVAFANGLMTQDVARFKIGQSPDQPR